jgi:hypothetical protein
LRATGREKAREREIVGRKRGFSRRKGGKREYLEKGSF